MLTAQATSEILFELGSAALTTLQEKSAAVTAAAPVQRAK
jgi:hypothetical protein